MFRRSGPRLAAPLLRAQGNIKNFDAGERVPPEPTTVVDAQRSTSLIDGLGANLRSTDGVDGHSEQYMARIVEMGIFAQDSKPDFAFFRFGDEMGGRFRQIRCRCLGLLV